MIGVDVVVPAWNSKRWIGDCLAALRRQSLMPRTIVVVDDGSTDGIGDWLRDHAPEVRVERLAERRGFAAAANHGIRAGKAPFVALLNADTEADPDWLRRLAGALESAPADTGSAASRMLQMQAPGSIDSAGDRFTRFGSAVKRGRGEPADAWATPGPVLSACAGAALYRRAMLEEIGLFDESFGSYLEDVDLGLRAQLAGYRCIYVPSAKVLHQGGGSGLPRGRYVRLVTANRVATVLHCFPPRLLWRHVLRLAWGQVYFFIVGRHPLRALLGYWDLLLRLPGVLARRREIQGRRKIDARLLDDLLGRELGEPPLTRLFARRARKLRSGA